MKQQTYLTAKGAKRLQVELENLVSVDRLEIARRLRSAIQMGDLSENADYKKAKEDQSFLEGRIQEIKYLLDNAIIVEESEKKPEVVKIDVSVTVQEDNQPPVTYHLVGAKEADPRKNRISNESPVGKELMGKTVGDEINAQTPGGKLKFKILEIE